MSIRSDSQAETITERADVEVIVTRNLFRDSCLRVSGDVTLVVTTSLIHDGGDVPLVVLSSLIRDGSDVAPIVMTFLTHDLWMVLHLDVATHTLTFFFIIILASPSDCISNAG